MIPFSSGVPDRILEAPSPWIGSISNLDPPHNDPPYDAAIHRTMRRSTVRCGDPPYNAARI
ncbi:MAG: hypothetical protein FJ308_22860 [Planctomycetes bacterium]|nr:hypothetical protein [Planctomycetota bacterium]